MTAWFRGEGYDPKDECPDNCTCSGCRMESDGSITPHRNDPDDPDTFWNSLPKR